ncbi:hypothetical protein HK102_005674 [Quaeritorhiza haematococci]|nr:hypothetical protein HK102_005674 [Quaeritorhiza haematococci]
MNQPRPHKHALAQKLSPRVIILLLCISASVGLDLVFPRNLFVAASVTTRNADELPHDVYRVGDVGEVGENATLSLDQQDSTPTLELLETMGGTIDSGGLNQEEVEELARTKGVVEGVKKLGWEGGEKAKVKSIIDSLVERAFDDKAKDANSSATNGTIPCDTPWADIEDKCEYIRSCPRQRSGHFNYYDFYYCDMEDMPVPGFVILVKLACQKYILTLDLVETGTVSLLRAF